MLIFALILQILSSSILLYPLSIQVKGLRKHWKTSRNGLRVTRVSIFLITLVLMLNALVNGFALYVALINGLLVPQVPHYMEFEVAILVNASGKFLASLAFAWLYYATRKVIDQ